MPCPVAESSHIIGKKWSIPIVEEVALGKFDGFNRFLGRSSGITPRILSIRLKELENASVLKKKSYARNNRRTARYELTQKGMELHHVVQQMKKWNIRWNDAPARCLDISCTECRLYMKQNPTE